MIKDWNEFALKNMNKKVVLISARGVGHEGIIRDFLPDSWIELIADYGLIRVAMHSIVDTGVLEDGEETSKMPPERFKELLDELDGNSLQTLKEKNARYAKNGDCLHNFRSGSAITRKTPAQTCWGYMSKHLTSLLDKVEANDFSDREDFLEKCQDTINYIRFLWCIGNDESSVELYDELVLIRKCDESVYKKYDYKMNPKYEIRNDNIYISYDHKYGHGMDVYPCSNYVVNKYKRKGE